MVFSGCDEPLSQKCAKLPWAVAGALDVSACLHRRFRFAKRFLGWNLARFAVTLDDDVLAELRLAAVFLDDGFSQ